MKDKHLLARYLDFFAISIRDMTKLELAQTPGKEPTVDFIQSGLHAELCRKRVEKFVQSQLEAAKAEARKDAYIKGYDVGVVMAYHHASSLDRKTTEIKRAAKNSLYMFQIAYPEGISESEAILHDTDNRKDWAPKLTPPKEKEAGL